MPTPWTSKTMCKFKSIITLIWLCTMCPIGKYCKPKFIESTDSMLKPIPGSDSHKVNQTCYDNYLPPYVIDQHHTNQHMLMCSQLNDSV